MCLFLEGLHMKQRVFSLALALVLLLGLVPTGWAAEAGSVINSDAEACLGGWYFEVDALNQGRLYGARYAVTVLGMDSEDPLDRHAVTDYPVSQVLAREGDLVIAAENRLLALDPDTGATEELLTAPEEVHRFAYRGEDLYYLAGERLYLLSGGRQQVLLEGITGFWLEENGGICYQTDGALIHTLDLNTGLETLRANNATDLGDVPLPSSTRSMHLGTLRQKFPNGKYWNHMPTRGTGAAYNNQDGWTETPCIPHNNYCGTSLQTCNGFDPTGNYECSWQCMGYAEKCGYDVTGYNPRLNQKGWTTLYNVSALSKLKAGDIVRYRNGRHTIYVVAVNGDQVTYTDCNSDSHCVIRWGQTVSLSTLQSSFSCLQSAPGAAPENGLDLMTDLPKPDSWAYEAVVWAVTRNIAGGTTPTTFSPKEECNRAQVVTFLWRAAGCPQPKTTVSPFRDVQAGSYYYEPVLWAMDRGITTGASESLFRPKDPCTRGQVVTFLWRYAGSPGSKGVDCPFTDVDQDSFCRSAVVWALSKGIAKGVTDTSFAPKQACTREQVVTFLYRLLG